MVSKTICYLWKLFNNFFEALIPLGDLFIRLWVARIFFVSGLNKIQNLDATFLLFRYEYEVPFFSPIIAAYITIFIEITFPIFLALGLLGRLPALILFFANIFAVYSYPFLWTDAGSIGFKDHFYWGIFLIILLLYGPGFYSVDNLIKLFWYKNKS